MMNIKNFVLNELSVNCFVCYDGTGDCIIVDPGCSEIATCSEITGFIKDNKLNPLFIINTHGHFDHVSGNVFMKNEYNCPLAMHEADLKMLKSSQVQAALFGLSVLPSPVPDMFLRENDVISFGNSRMKVIEVPGHSQGSICLYSEDEKMLICGDVLFNGSIGRTDLFGGNYLQLLSGIKNKLLVLPPETTVYPGHGSFTTIGNEHDSNPFLK